MPRRRAHRVPRHDATLDDEHAADDHDDELEHDDAHDVDHDHHDDGSATRHRRRRPRPPPPRPPDDANRAGARVRHQPSRRPAAQLSAAIAVLAAPRLPRRSAPRATARMTRSTCCVGPSEPRGERASSSTRRRTSAPTRARRAQRISVTRAQRQRGRRSATRSIAPGASSRARCARVRFALDMGQLAALDPLPPSRTAVASRSRSRRSRRSTRSSARARDRRRRRARRPARARRRRSGRTAAAGRGAPVEPVGPVLGGAGEPHADANRRQREQRRPRRGVGDAAHRQRCARLEGLERASVVASKMPLVGVCGSAAARYSCIQTTWSPRAPFLSAGQRFRS